MKVLKFGGTSVGSVEGMLRVKQVVEAISDNVIVVVSALGGMTDHLLMTAQMAARGEASYAAELERIVERHKQQMYRVVLPHRMEQIESEVAAMLDELSNIYKGVFLIKDLSAKTNDTIVSYGERLSSMILSGVIDYAELYDARRFIKTRAYYNKHVIENSTEGLVREAFARQPRVAIVPGFIAADHVTGDVTNLGRGGSDYTASIIAAALDASILEIWTDVDGFLTADPKVISNAYVIDRLTFVEAMELCNFGAKVVYPPTIFPVYHKDIPIIIKNTFNPESSGTLISKEKVRDAEKPIIKGISSVSDTSLITIRGLGMVGVIGVNYRIFKALAKAGVSVFMVSQAASENTTSIAVRRNDAEVSVEVLTAEFREEMALGEINRIKVKHDLATVAIVGEGMKNTPGVAGKLFGTLGRNGINVIACAQGASETNISFVIDLVSLRKALNVIHDSFFLSDYQVLNIFLAGTGLVGSSLLEQIRLQQQKLRDKNALEIRVVGITNSRKYVVCREGIDLATYCQQLGASENIASPEAFRDEILGMNIFNSVFVDCTANEAVAAIYKPLLEHNVSVVTANKIAASSSYETYDELKSISRKRGVKFLFETNVGAGLPILNTISDLINSGDTILRIQAVVSGTLNFIFNEMNESIPMSRAIAMAKDAGYAEPDPRIDLSGMDVVRKLVILSREAGYRVEQDDVRKNLFIPAKYFEGTVDDFWRAIPAIDAEFEERRRKLVEANRRWRFVATMDEGRTEVALREVEPNSPFYDLEGSNNVVLLTTERYKKYPLQIKGYGAGAEVTAAGVFADIISIANIR